MSDLGIFDTAVMTLGLTEGIREAENNLINIQAASAKLDAELKLKDAEKRKVEAEIESKLINNEIDQMTADFIKSKFGEQHKMIKDRTKYLSSQLQSEAVRENQRKAELSTMATQVFLNRAIGNVQPQTQQEPDIVSNIMPGVEPDLDVSFSRKVGPFTVKSDPNDVSTQDKVMGSIQEGGTINAFGDLYEFSDREQARRFVASKLGGGWEKKFPKVQKALDEKFPEADKHGYRMNEIQTDAKGRKYRYIGNGKFEEI